MCSSDGVGGVVWMVWTRFEEGGEAVFMVGKFNHRDIGTGQIFHDGWKVVEGKIQAANALGSGRRFIVDLCVLFPETSLGDA